MPSESVKLFRLAQFEYKCSAPVIVTLYTDLPGTTLSLRETLPTLPASASTRTIQVPLKGTTKGHIFKVRIDTTGKLYLYLAELYLRKLGRTASDWQWYSLGVTPTGNVYTDLKMPIEPTQDGYTNLKMPIDPTQEGHSDLRLPITPTADEYTPVRVPMRPSPDDLVVVELPMDE